MSTDVHSLVGAYVLDALEPGERAAFAAHLVDCETCREEVDSLYAAATELAVPIAAQPPADLRERVLAAAAATPQQRPLGPLGPRAARRRLPLALAAAAAAVALGVGVTTVVTHDDHPTTAAQVLAAPDVRMHRMATPHGDLMVAMSHRMRMVAVDTTHLTRPDGMTYQVWWHTADGMRSVGVLDARMALAVPMRSGDLMLTMEPMGGSTTPSTSVLLQIPSTDL